MSEHDELSGTTLGGKLGCLAGALVGLPVLGVLMFLSFYGDCFNSEQCHRGEGLRFVVVILVTRAVAVPVALLTRKLVNGRIRERS
jgi:hypothetical protein